MGQDTKWVCLAGVANACICVKFIKSIISFNMKYSTKKFSKSKVYGHSAATSDNKVGILTTLVFGINCYVTPLLRACHAGGHAITITSLLPMRQHFRRHVAVGMGVFCCFWVQLTYKIVFYFLLNCDDKNITKISERWSIHFESQYMAC